MFSDIAYKDEYHVVNNRIPFCYGDGRQIFRKVVKEDPDVGMSRQVYQALSETAEYFMD